MPQAVNNNSMNLESGVTSPRSPGCILSEYSSIEAVEGRNLLDLTGKVSGYDYCSSANLY